MNERARVEARPRLSDGERREAVAIVDGCGREGLSLKLDLDVLRERDGETIAFVAHRGGALAGFCTLDSGRDMELCGAVHADHRRRGIGRALLAAALDESRRLGRERALVICEDASAAGVALLTATGATRAFAEHRMDLAELCHAPPADDRLVVARATPPDAAEVAHVIAVSMKDAEERARAEVARDLESATNRYYLSRLEGAAVGSLKIAFGRGKAYIYGFSVLPEHRRRGLGRQMLGGVIEALRAEGHQHIALEVESENAPAIGLYRAMGFSVTTTYGYYEIDLRARSG